MTPSHASNPPNYLGNNGINIDIGSKDYGWMLQGKDHQGSKKLGSQGVHPDWNKEWKKWLKKNKGKFSKDQLLGKLKKMKEQFGLVNKSGSVLKGKPATMSWKAWKKHLKEAFERAAREGAEKAAKEATEKSSKKGFTHALKKGGKKLLKKVPLVGAFFFGMALGKGGPAYAAGELIWPIPNPFPIDEPQKSDEPLTPRGGVYATWGPHSSRNPSRDFVLERRDIYSGDVFGNRVKAGERHYVLWSLGIEID